MDINVPRYKRKILMIVLDLIKHLNYQTNILFKIICTIRFKNA